MAGDGFLRKNIYRLSTLFIGLLIALILSEIGLRLILSFRDENKFYVWPPDMRRTFVPLSGVLPGVEGPSRFYINSEGVRGAEYPKGQGYRIMAIGGSTTECLYLDQAESWPYILQKKLNTTKMKNIWVGNAGRSGRNTRDYIMQIRYFLPQCPKTDLIIILAGANDFMLRLRRDIYYDPDFLIREGSELYQINRAFSVVPFRKRFKSIVIWDFAKRVKNTLSQIGRGQDKMGGFYIRGRREREGADIVEELPDLAPALEEYSRNLNAIIDMAQAKSIRLVFLTQPHLWKEEMGPQERALLWMGWVGEDGQRYYSVKALARGIEKYNKKLVEVCRARGVEYIDLAKKLPKDTTVFYDDLHFNENGSRMVAEIIFKYLNSKEPFA